MKKILVTGSFEGAVKIVYGESGMGEEAHPPLLSADFAEAVINDKQKAYLMGVIPVRYGAGFEQAFPLALKVFVEDMEVDFIEDFWKPYGNKINKDRCLNEWNKMTKVERALACARLHAYLRHLSRKGVGKADPENYLKKKYFKNDYDNL